MGKIENIAPPHGQMPWQNYRMKKLLSHIESNHRNPSKHRLEEHAMLNWVKQQRKLHNAEAARYLLPLHPIIEIVPFS